MQKQPAEEFFKKGVMRNFVTIKHLCQNLFFDKPCRSVSLLKRRLQCKCFFCEFCEICKNTFIAEHHWTTASDYSSIISIEVRIG